MTFAEPCAGRISAKSLPQQYFGIGHFSAELASERDFGP
jgi:hypothetical protein